MLVLSRKLGDRILIGEDVCITVAGIGRGQVRIGVEAPRHVPIRRQELPPRAAAPADPGIPARFPVQEHTP